VSGDGDLIGGFEKYTKAPASCQIGKCSACVQYSQKIINSYKSNFMLPFYKMNSNIYAVAGENSFAANSNPRKELINLVYLGWFLS